MKKDTINKDDIAIKIRKQALEIGYKECGIIPVSDGLEGYEEYLDQRYDIFPDDKEISGSNYKMAHPEKEYPWAKSIVICTIAFADYELPKEYEHRIARLYAFDYRHEKTAEEYGWEEKMRQFFESMNIRYASSPDRGIVPLRQVAARAGLGRIRRNNFFYTKEYGSYVALCAWLIDQELTYTHECDLPPCPEKCRCCIEACPSKSLSAPYTMHRRTCVSPLNSKYPEGNDVTKDDIGLYFDGWLYGCDSCQNACPHNKAVLRKIHPNRVFPRQEEFRSYMEPMKLLSLSDEYLEEHFQERFWYMPKGSTWKWKANAMCDLIHHPSEAAKEIIKQYCSHENEELRRVAVWALEKMEER